MQIEADEKIEILFSIGISKRRMMRDMNMCFETIVSINKNKTTIKRINDYYVSIIKKLVKGS